MLWCGPLQRRLKSAASDFLGRQKVEPFAASSYLPAFRMPSVKPLRAGGGDVAQRHLFPCNCTKGSWADYDSTIVGVAWRNQLDT